MPLLMRLNDSEIEPIEFMIAEFANGLDYLWCVQKQMRSGGVSVNKKAAGSDLNVEPVHGDFQYAS